MNKCIAYKEDGTICDAPACVIDEQRGGMVCVDHAPAIQSLRAIKAAFNKVFLGVDEEVPDGRD